MGVLLLYLAHKERWVVRPFSDRYLTEQGSEINLENTTFSRVPGRHQNHGFLSLKAENLAKQTSQQIWLMMTPPDSNGICHTWTYSAYQYFVVKRLQYLCEVKNWDAAALMNNEAVEMAAEILEKWPDGALNIYQSLSTLYLENEEIMGDTCNTQKTIDNLAQQIAILEERLPLMAGEEDHLPASLYCRLGESRTVMHALI